MKTKQAFKQYLNQKYGYSVDRQGSLTGATKRLYGDYLYTADREVFNMCYERWINTGTDEE